MKTAALAPLHAPVREAWLALHEEPVLEPDRPIIDAHHHMWDKLDDRYLRAELAADIRAGHNVVATVFVEGNEGYRRDGPEELRPLGETEMAAEIAEASARAGGPFIASGIVARVDLALGAESGKILDAHLDLAGGRMRGVRHATAWHADPEARGSTRMAPPGQLYDPQLRDGLRELAARGLVFDAWMYHTQLNDLVDLAHAIPNLQIVLNHIGGPLGIGPYAGREIGVRADLRHHLMRLAEFPNVVCKLGGLGMPMSGFRFHEAPHPPESYTLAQAWRPLLRTCIEVFGPDRCMFESNFPVDKGTVAYPVLWNAFKTVTGDFSETEKQALFFDTANRVYALGLQAGTFLMNKWGNDAAKGVQE